jgi:hypothetical protein
VTNPLPLACIALVLALPGVYLLGRRLSDWMEDEREVRGPVALVAAVSVWLQAVATTGRITGSFVAGLSVGTALVALAGVAWTVWRRGGGTPGEAAVGGPPRSSRSMWVSGVLVTLPIAYMTLAADFFDDYNLIGHRSLIAQLQNGSYPPRHQVFPDYPFRYHFGFNIVGAALTGFFRLPVGAAIDAIVIAGFLGSWCLAWRLGERLTGTRTGMWTAFAGLLGGGAFFWFFWHSDWAQHGAVGIVIGGNRINFPVVMYFFQKPFALGFPLALGLMLAASVPATGVNWRPRAVLLALLLAPLSLAEVVLFVTMGPALLAQDLWTERKWRACLAPVAALLLALPLGGVLFTPMPAETVSLIAFRFWPAAHPLRGVLQWYFLTTGLLVPLGLLGVRVMPRLRAFFLLMILGSFGVPLFFHDPNSWDIVKFSTVGQLAAGLAAGSALAWIAAGAGRRRIPVLAVLSALLAASTVGYVGHWIREIVRPTPEIGQLLVAQRQPYEDRDWSSLLRWLRRVRPRGAIHCTNPLLLRQLLFAGLYTAGPSDINAQYGVPQKRVARRQALLEQLPPDPKRWREEGVDWIVTGPGEPLDQVVTGWVATGQARRAWSSGPWGLARLVEPRATGQPAGPGR